MAAQEVTLGGPGIEQPYVLSHSSSVDNDVLIVMIVRQQQHGQYLMSVALLCVAYSTAFMLLL